MDFYKEETFTFDQMRDMFMYVACGHEKQEYQELMAQNHMQNAFKLIIDVVISKVSYRIPFMV